MIADAIAILQMIRGGLQSMKEGSILSALFDWRGKRLHGDPIEVRFTPDEENSKTIWWYQVVPQEAYVFLRLPVNVGAVVEELSHPEDEEDAADDSFRFLPASTGSTSEGRLLRNVRMNFMVFGYQPLLLLDMLKVKAPRLGD